MRVYAVSRFDSQRSASGPGRAHGAAHLDGRRCNWEWRRPDAGSDHGSLCRVGVLHNFEYTCMD
jgi:hypothetical protein